MSTTIVDEPEEARLQRQWEMAVEAPWRAMSASEVARRWAAAGATPEAEAEADVEAAADD